MENINIYDEHVEPGFAEKLASYLLLLFVFLLPLFFISPSFLSFQMSKSIFIAGVVLIPVIASLVTLLRKKEIIFTKNPVIVAACAIPVVMFIAALISGTMNVSFLGQGFETSTVSFIALMFFTMLLPYVLLRNRDKVLKIYTAFFFSISILILFHVLRLVFGTSFLSFGFLTTPISNLIGKWNDLGILLGSGAFLSLITLEFLPLGKFHKILVSIIGILAFFLIFLVNFPLIWYALAIFAVIVGAYKYITQKDAEMVHKKSAVPYLSIIVFIVCLLVINDNHLGSLSSDYSLSLKIVNHFHLAQLEVRPSWSATFDIATNMFKNHPATIFFGAGPNRFINEYLAYKPQEINSTLFWNYDFDSGIGFIPSFFITTGILGILAWLIFLFFFVYKGLRVISRRRESALGRYIAFSSFIMALYFWVMAIFYTTGATNTVLAFLFTGIALAVFNIEKQGYENIVIHFAHRKHIVKIACYTLLVILLVGVLSWFANYLRVAIASAYFQNGIVAINTTGSIDDAENALLKAVWWRKNDVYYQGLAELSLLKMSNLVNKQDANSPQNVALMQQYLTSAINYSGAAVEYNPANYQNWVEAGRVFESVVPLQVKDSLTGATNSYIQAINNNPSNPALYLMLARLSAANKDYENAKKYIAGALTLKNNYAEAAFLLSQVQVQEGNVADAIKSVQAATQFSPNDSTIFFQLGLLEYNVKNYNAAIDALERAVALDSQYSNARYFLGLSLYNVGKIDEAISQFQTVLQYNPGNQEVTLILDNLKSGKAPFADAKAPIDNKPEKRKTLPVKDDTKTKAATETI